MKLSEYEWPRPPRFAPFAHQKITSEFLIRNKKAFCFNEQGTGKTASVIWAVDYLMTIGVVKRVLVICPLSIMKSAWQNDLFKFAIHRTVSIAYGNAEKRKQIINGKAEFVIINFDGVEIVKNEIANGGFDLIVVDEASAYKNAQTDRWKTLRDLSRIIKGLWMLTGTPAAQSPTDAYGLARLVNPTGVPMFFGQFRDLVMDKVTTFKWRPKPNAMQTVHKVLQPAIRFEKRQCIDLPPLVFVDREAPLSPQQHKYYAILKKQMLIEAAGEEVSAVNAAVQINKLLQISGGAVYTDTGEIIEFDVSSRLKIVHEVIDESSHKVLVFVPFTHTIELLKKYLNKNNITCEIINGDVNVNKRSEIVQRFQDYDDIKVLIIQPQAASHGLTLTAANTIIWYAPCNSVETYLQANARIDRPGQVNNMTIVHITGSPIESRVYKLLQGNVDNHQKIIDLYKQEISTDTIDNV
jgi:SNF2 family DNA or RNA helicase